MNGANNQNQNVQNMPAQPSQPAQPPQPASQEIIQNQPSQNQIERQGDEIGNQVVQNVEEEQLFPTLSMDQFDKFEEQANE